MTSDSDATTTLPGHPGRAVVLEPLDNDCFRDGELHEGIRLRLLRIRELPSRSVATLLGVWRREGRAWLAWEFLPGPTLDQLLRDESIPADRLHRAVESLRRCVLSLHRLGLVHGDLRAENVVFRDDEPVLTRLSPLLHHDPQRDLDALASIESLLRGRLAGRTGGDNVSTAVAPAGDRTAGDRRPDARGWIGLAAAIASGGLVSLLAWWLAGTGD